MYNTDTTAVDNKITFKLNDKVVDEYGNTWKPNIALNKLERFNEDNTLSTDFLVITSDGNNPATYTSEDIKTATNLLPSTQSGLLLETKHSIFEDLNVIINALHGYNTISEDGSDDGKRGTLASDEEVNIILSNSLEKISRQYDASNIGHAELGGRNKIFNTALESISTKVTHFNILMQETNGADMGKLAMESKSLEMTYNALYSTVAKMHQLSLVNFLK
jgi:flagellar hook-associated protein 3 FlgL